MPLRTRAQATSMSSELRDLLHQRGQRVTSQRLVIHAALEQLGRHTSADELLRVVSDRLPGVSLPTVYSTLELLEELGLVRRVPGAGGATLWDPGRDPHHHVACRRCGRVEDLEANVDAAGALAAARRRGFVADHAGLLVSGLCPACARLPLN
jgi:Fe2+ or Zn2+ uptake regulation protein